MNHLFSRAAILGLAVGITASLSAQTLSDFSGLDPNGWSGSINGTTTFPNGSTAISAVTESGNDVLNLSDGGFGGGAVRTYTGLPTTGFVTITARARIVTDPGTLTPDPNSNPGTFGTAFGIAAGSVGLADQAFGYGRSLSTAADDSGQDFATYAATVRADGSGEFTAFFMPEQHDGAVGGGTWVAQLDDIAVAAPCTSETLLSDFAVDADSWASTSMATSPFGSAFTGIAQAGGELVLTDGGFTGGAFRTYTGAAPSAGVHVVFVDVRIVTDNGSLDRARIAAVAGGPTTDYSDLSFSQSFSTTADDSGQLFQTVAVPVVTDAPSDITVYMLSDYDAAVAGGSWEIHVDNVRVSNPDLASVAMSSACAAGYHTMNGPVLSFANTPKIGQTFTVDGSNMIGTPLCALILGEEVSPVPLTIIGSFVGSQACVTDMAIISCPGGSTASGSVPIPLDANICGITLAAQWIDFDPTLVSATVTLPFGTSQAGTWTIGN